MFHNVLMEVYCNCKKKLFLCLYKSVSTVIYFFVALNIFLFLYELIILCQYDMKQKSISVLLKKKIHGTCSENLHTDVCVKCIFCFQGQLGYIEQLITL